MSNSDGYGSGDYGSNGYGGSDDGDPTQAPTQAPFGDEPHTIPGRIQAQDFDQGGEGVAYHETDPPADWAADVRGTDIDFKPTPDDSGEFSVGRFHSEEWLEYTCAVEPGVYNLLVRCGTAHEGRQLTVTLDGEPLATVDVPVTGWSAHQTVTAEVDIGGEAGERVLRLSPAQDGVDVNWVEFVSVEAPAPEPEPEPEPDPEPEPEPTVSHTTVTISHGEGTDRVVLLGQAPDAVSASVTGGLEATPRLVIGDIPQCAGLTGDGDRCSRDADILDGSETCWQHDASDIPDGGW